MNRIIFLLTGVVVKGNSYTIRGILTIRSRGKESIILGDKFTIHSGKRYNIIGNDYRTVFRTIQNGTIIIGNHVGISNSALVSASRIVIEDNVMIGGNCRIYDTDFHSIIACKREFCDEKGGETIPITIQKGAFIGADTIILKGVTIGERAVVGAGSVVTKDIPHDEIWGGNPAHFIKKL